MQTKLRSFLLWLYYAEFGYFEFVRRALVDIVRFLLP